MQSGPLSSTRGDGGLRNETTSCESPAVAERRSRTPVGELVVAGLFALIFVVGVIVILMPRSAGGIDCGSAVAPSSAQTPDCEALLDDRRFAAYPLVGGSLVVVLYMVATRGRAEDPTTDH